MPRIREDRRAYLAAYYQRHKERITARRDAIRRVHKEERLAYRAAHQEEREAHKKANRSIYDSAHRTEKREKDARQQRWFLGNLRLLKVAQGCEDCQTSEGILDHHHIDPSTKGFSVSQMCNNSLESFMDEIAKCTVLCRSCHRARHKTLRSVKREELLAMGKAKEPLCSSTHFTYS